MFDVALIWRCSECARETKFTKYENVSYFSDGLRDIASNFASFPMKLTLNIGEI